MEMVSILSKSQFFKYLSKTCFPEELEVCRNHMILEIIRPSKKFRSGWVEALAKLIILFFGFWSNRIFVQCTNFLVPCKATPVRTSIEKFPLAIWRNRRSNFISLGQHTKEGAIFTWNIPIQKSHLTLILVKIMHSWSLAQVGGIIYPVAIKYDSKFGDAFWNRCQLSSRQWHWW